MTAHRVRQWISATGILLIVARGVSAQELCIDRAQFEKNAWQLEPVQQAMDLYLRDHRMRASWMHEPRPPDALGKDYYEWLWTNEFGARMKIELVRRYCGGGEDSNADR